MWLEQRGMDEKVRDSQGCSQGPEGSARSLAFLLV